MVETSNCTTQRLEQQLHTYAQVKCRFLSKFMEEFQHNQACFARPKSYHLRSEMANSSGDSPIESFLMRSRKNRMFRGSDSKEGARCFSCLYYWKAAPKYNLLWPEGRKAETHCVSKTRKNQCIVVMTRLNAMKEAQEYVPTMRSCESALRTAKECHHM